MNTLTSLARNTLFGILTSVLSRIGNTILFIAVINAVSVESGGTYNLALAFFFIASRFALWGLDHLLTREVAKEPDQGAMYLSNFLFARVILGLLVIVIFGLIVQLIGYDPTTKLVIFIMLLSVLPENVNNLCWSAFAAFEEFHLSSIGMTANVFIKLGLGLVLLRQGAELEIVVLAILVGNLVAMVINLLLVRRRYLPDGWLRPDLSFLKKQLPIAVPFIFIGAFFILDNRLDNVLLSIFSNEEEIGLYGAAMAIIMVINLLPEGYRIAILPVMARHQSRDANLVQTLYSRSYKFLLAAALPAAVGAIFMADEIIQLVYRQELPGAALSLRILAIALCFMFINVLNNRLLIIHNRQDVIARFLVVAFLTNVVFNLLLLSRYGAQGAAVSRTASVLALFLLSSWAASRFVDDVGRRHYLWRLVVSTAVMAVVLWQLANWNMWIQLIAGGTTYLLLLLLTRFMSPDEMQVLRQLVNRQILRKS